MPIAVGKPVVEQALIGTVKDKDTDLPIMNTTIELNDGNIVIATSQTNPDGKYEINDLEAKEYTISAVAEGYTTILSNVIISAGEVTTKDFLMERTAGTFTEKEIPKDADGSLSWCCPS
ncbi:hypothetical protein AZF37_02830 [endosymbiont 'TC1' of Trimyema compressum]|uniref:carboxypeptidase-like regulatory domain-containing protein n=1 Tax=endosymbiont 'TC1' of Trimyema compressum TaxID=243899 RepID=UPI0007F05C4B|nr:carboxypeptidase-like regulatory domain-containing protein [endosymbiont 'TC1' of Trimyema compressum]AMP20249.1 hypothetical protein AZF37_02830 [endosymbiont 'TC1' of Trimyema compressum]